MTNVQDRIDEARDQATKIGKEGLERASEVVTTAKSSVDDLRDRQPGVFIAAVAVAGLVAIGSLAALVVSASRR